jgi:hypothetical protein
LRRGRCIDRRGTIMNLLAETETKYAGLSR